MLDVITIISETTPRAFVRQSLDSVRVAANLASFDVSCIRAPGVPGHIGQALREGLNRSSAPWVCFVDDDDFVLPNAFECLAGAFASEPAAICARELHLFANGYLTPARRRHHLTVYRADVAQRLPLQRMPNFTPFIGHAQAAARGLIVDVLNWVYVYRRRLSAGLQVRAQHHG